MKLYLAHSSAFDYKTELYKPLKESIGVDHDIFFPHDKHEEGVESKDIIARSDLVLAEVSYPSTGQGIELGWANANNIPILCFYRKGSSISSSLRFIASDIFEYDSKEDMITKLNNRIAIKA